MSKRSDLRKAALIRAGWKCEWLYPEGDRCMMPGKLEMAHLKGSGSGGSKYRDVLDNVAILCTYHHDWLDGRLHGGRRFDNEEILRVVLGRPWPERR